MAHMQGNKSFEWTISCRALEARGRPLFIIESIPMNFRNDGSRAPARRRVKPTLSRPRPPVTLGRGTAVVATADAQRLFWPKSRSPQQFKRVTAPGR